MPILLTQVAGSVSTQPTQATGATDAQPPSAVVVQEQPAQAQPTPSAAHLRGLHTRKDVRHADSLVEQIIELQQRALSNLTKAEVGQVDERGNAYIDFKAVASLMGQARSNLEFQAKLLGLLQSGSAVQVNFFQAPPVQAYIGSSAEFMLALAPGESRAIEAWLEAAKTDADGAQSDPAGWLQRYRGTIVVEAEES